PLVVCASLLLRQLVSNWPYSGARKPPMFGDYEAQRHWMELTVSLPVGRWYWYDLSYWGLDYPPLTAYVSWAWGKLSLLLEPASMALGTSRGYETLSHKLFMRLSVTAMDVTVFFPSTLLAAQALRALPAAAAAAGKSSTTGMDAAQKPARSHESFKPEAAAAGVGATALMALLQPGLILIDHGHFQYNGVCLGLAVAAAVAVASPFRHGDILGSVLFCLSLNFKQMALYYAPVFFFFLLARCIYCKPATDGDGGSSNPTGSASTVNGTASGRKTVLEIAAGVAKLGLVVVATFAVMWAPFCWFSGPDRSCTEGLAQVLRRQFPFSRGIFEDKVATVWFCLDVLFKLRTKMDTGNMAACATAATLCLLAPVGVDLLRPGRPLMLRRLLLAMFNS
ncbi:unnamed protein product, partial [Phaeothamnion confervicola]